MGLAQIGAPALEPLTVTEARNHLRLGSENAEVAPAAPLVALAGAGAGNVDNGVHRYRATFVTADGETEGGDISAIVTVADKTVNGKVNVTGIPIGSSSVTARKLYRTIAGGAVYLFVATIADNVTTAYVDNIADAGLGAAVPAVNTTIDPQLRSLITAARQHVENLGIALISQQLRLTKSAFPQNTGALELPRPPLLSVESVKYLDTAGIEQTLAAGDYVVDLTGYRGTITPAFGKTWPQTRDGHPAAIKVDFTAGFGVSSASVPEPLRAAMLLLIGDLYMQRSAGIVGTIHTDNPAVDNLLAPYRQLEMA